MKKMEKLVNSSFASYRTICAFANDFDETGGGYIVIGVKEENGRPVRPVIGIV